MRSDQDVLLLGNIGKQIQKGGMMKKWIRAAVILLNCFLVTGCGTVQGSVQRKETEYAASAGTAGQSMEEETENTGHVENFEGQGTGGSAQQRIEATPEPEPDSEQSVDPVQEDDMKKEIKELAQGDVLSFVRVATGIDFQPYAEDADGICYNGLYYVRVHIRSGEKKDAEGEIRELCGESLDPEDLLLPGVRNRICDDLKQAASVTGYTCMRQGENGAKTSTTDFYLSEEDGHTSVYVIGYN